MTEDMGMLGGAVWDVLTGEALREYCIKQNERLVELTEALRWSLAELDGHTRYDKDWQRTNAFAEARAALARAEAPDAK